MCDLPLEDVASLTGYENINKCIILYMYIALVQLMASESLIASCGAVSNTMKFKLFLSHDAYCL